MTARDLMTEYPHLVLPDDPISHAAALMRDSEVGFVPVVADRESQRLIGVITDRDITVRHVASAHVNECRVAQHMTSADLATVTAGASAEDVHQLMGARQVRRLPVVDAEARVIGVIAQAGRGRAGIARRCRRSGGGGDLGTGASGSLIELETRV